MLVGTFLILGAALITAENVAGHLARTAGDESIRAAEAVVRGLVDPILTHQAMADPEGEEGAEINQQLESLTASGDILRIKIWSHDGTILFSDLAALRGMQFEVGRDLEEALEGETDSEITALNEGDENVYERGLAESVLEIYLPIVDADGAIVAAYEIYEDAAPIEANIALTRRDVFLIASGAAVALLALLWIAFAGTSRLMATQNRQLRNLADDLKRREARFRSLVQNSSDTFVVLGRDGLIHYESVAVERVLGYRPQQRIGRRFFELVHDDDVAGAEKLISEVVARPDLERVGELRMRHADGSWRVLECVATNLLDDPAVAGVVLNYRDVTERKALEAQLTHQAFHDPLTGLANRALFIDRVQHALVRRAADGRRVAVIFCDLDDFKTINDSLGHAAGDEVLAAVAERFGRALRPADTVARLGGDEFAFLVEDVSDTRRAVSLARRVSATLAAPFAIAGKEVVVRASLGIAVSRRSVDDAGTLLRNADAAMYTAKAAERGGYAVFEPGMHQAAVERLELEADLRLAIERNQLVLHYQPIVALDSQEIVGFEALVRWQHPERGLLAPASFLRVAEETGLILPIGQWVLTSACHQGRRWQANAPPATRPSISINLSAQEIHDPTLVERVAGVLRETHVDVLSVILEITETSMLQDADATVTTLAGLKRLGVKLAIDDFGTGYSSLSYLRRLPVDILKIDRSFVRGAGRSREDETLIEAVFRMGHSLGMQTVVEGIEDPEQRDHLLALGCEFGQGFYFGRPVEAAAASELLRGQAARARGAARVAVRHSSRGVIPPAA
ncbi:MAG: putative bifunctional diguanylate cyclase/phosphodiesterase [Candidatus Limnocylindria bacterium]